MQAELIAISASNAGISAGVNHMGYKLHQKGNNLFAHGRSQYIGSGHSLARLRQVPAHDDFVTMRVVQRMFERCFRWPSFPPFRSRLKAPACFISSSASTGRPGAPRRRPTAIASPPRPSTRSSSLERKAPEAPVQSALFSQLGHKGDLILIHFRDSFEALNQVELDLAQTELYDLPHACATPMSPSSNSASTSPAARPTKPPAAKGLEPNTPEWKAEVAASLERASAAMAPRLFPAVPEAKYLCFYPMDRKRGEQATGTPCPSPSASA